MFVFSIPNLSVSKVDKIPIESLPTLRPRPEQFLDKAAYLAWAQDDSTNHCFYSGFQGEDIHARISGSNPPRYIHGIICDYDTFLSADDLANGLKRQSIDYPVAYTSSTFSHGVRLVFAFEQPIAFFNDKAFKRFIKAFKGASKVKKLLPGLDEPALEDPAKYYELGTNWTATGHPKVKATVIASLMFATFQGVNLFEGELPELPWEVIAAEIAKRWPGKWKGTVGPNTRGVRFWDSTAKDDTAAVLTPQGVQYFSDGGGFLPWGSTLLFGPEFVQSYEANKLGKAIIGIYSDGSNFWRQTEDGVWRMQSGDKLMNKLLNIDGMKLPEARKAIALIDEHQWVEAVGRHIFRKETIVEYNGQRHLNISTVRPLDPATDKGETWGDGFPWIAQFLTTFFEPREPQLDFFLSWLHWFYFNSVRGEPQRGQALFLVGDAGSGKTFIVRRIIGALLGGFQDIEDYLTGKDMYNENVFKSGIGFVDDGSVSPDFRSHAAYSNKLKKLIASPDISMRRMYSSAAIMPWNGRVIVAANNDAESMQMLPSLGISNRDKLIVLRIGGKHVFPTDADQIVAEELPFFGRYLTNYTIPQAIRARRFGVEAYCNPALEALAQPNNPNHFVLELIEEWRDEYFETHEGKTSADFSTCQLHEQITLMSSHAAREVSVARLGRVLTKLAEELPWITRNRGNKGTYYTIKKSR